MAEPESKQNVEFGLREAISQAHCILWNAEVSRTAEKVYRWQMKFYSSETLRREYGLFPQPGEDETEVWRRLISAAPGQFERINKTSHNAIESGQDSFQQEFYITAADGSRRWLKEYVRINRPAPGECRLFGVAVDVTDRKEAEERLALVLSGARCLLWHATVTQDGKEYHWDIHISNPEAGQRLLKQKLPPGRTELDAHLWHASKLAEDREKMHLVARRAIEDGRTGYSQEYRFKRGDGEIRWLSEHVRITPIRPGQFNLFGVCVDITENKHAEEKLIAANEALKQLASHDSLTGLLNRRIILEMAQSEWTRWQRYGTVFSLLLIDVDHFKQLNDTYGHLGGDKALTKIGQQLQQSIRTVDTVGRYGGEEFLVLLPETPPDGAAQTADKLLRGVAGLSLDLSGETVSATISIGVATVSTSDKTVDTLLHRADESLYAAKKAGRNQVKAASHSP